MKITIGGAVACNLLMGVAAAVATGSAQAAVTVDNGYIAGATVKGSVLYRSFNGTSKEVYLDESDITCARSGGCTLVGTSNDINYGSGSGSRTITFEYDGAAKTLKTVYTRASATTVTTSETYSVDLGELNYLAFEVRNPNEAKVVLANVVVSKGTTVFTTDLFGGSLGAKDLVQRYVTGENLSGGFKVSATLNVVDSAVGGDASYVLMKVGYIRPSDSLAPIVRNVHLTPTTALLNGTADVEANVDDTGRGGSTIAAADYRLDADLWRAMFASDTVFDSTVEDVEVMTDTLTEVGVHTACVRGTDSAGNVSGSDPAANDGNNPCVDFLVAYAFGGFFQPIDNVNINVAQAGRAIPLKWSLADANGAPVSDPASFVNLRSYPINCNDLTGSVLDSVEEYSSGSSGLQYNGDGYWQFNWKTPTTYAGTCRAAYVEFNSTQVSPVAKFKFKK